MRSYKQIITVVITLTALASTQTAYCMKRITSFFGGSSSKKEDTRPSRDNSTTRSKSSRDSDSRSSRQTPQELNRTLGELFPGESSRSSSRSSREDTTAGSRDKALQRLGTTEKEVAQSETKSRSFMQRAQDLVRGKKTESEKDIVISSPRNFRDMSTPEAEKIKLEAATIAGDTKAIAALKGKQIDPKIAAATEGAKWEKKEIPYEIQSRIDQKNKLDERLDSRKLQEPSESKTTSLEEKQSRVQELGSKIQAERSKDLSPQEKAQSKETVAQYEKEIRGLSKGVREEKEKQRIATLPLDEHKAEVKQLRQQADEYKKSYTAAQATGDDMAIAAAKKDLQRSEVKAKLAEVRLEERQTPQEAEPIKKSTPKKSVTFNETIQTSDNQPTKVYDPTAIPAKGILKKPTVQEDVFSASKLD